MAISIEARVTLADRLTRRLRESGKSVNRWGRIWRRTAIGAVHASRLVGRAAHRLATGGIARVNKVMGLLARRAKFALIGLQLTATLMAGFALHAGLTYERSLRNITSLMTGVGVSSEYLDQQFVSMDGSVRRMAVRWGKAPDDLAKGMYNVVSATFDGQSGMMVLEESSKLATAGLTDVDTATGLLTKSLQAYRVEGETNADLARKAAGYNDLFFTALKRGIFTMDEFAAKFPELPATMAAFGVEIEEVVALMSTLTRAGLSFDEAVTGVRALALNIGSVAPQSAKAAKDLWGEDWEKMWGPAALAAQGFEGVMQNLKKVLPEITPEILDVAASIEAEGGLAAAQQFLAETTGESIVTITNLIPNVRALKAAVVLAGPGMQGFTEDLLAMENATGAADSALSEMEKTAQFWKDRLSAVWSTIQVDIGALAFPAITSVGEGVTGWMGDLAGRFAIETDQLPVGLAGEELTAAVDKTWDEASPWDRLYFLVTTGWSDLMVNLNNWWTSGGEGQTHAFGEKLGNVIRGLFGIGAGGAPGSDSLGYQIGETFVSGIVEAFEGFSWDEFIDGTLGKAIVGMAAWKLLFGGGGGGAAGAVAGGVGFQAGKAAAVGIGKVIVMGLGGGVATAIGVATAAAIAGVLAIHLLNEKYRGFPDVDPTDVYPKPSDTVGQGGGSGGAEIGVGAGVGGIWSAAFQQEKADRENREKFGVSASSRHALRNEPMDTGHTAGSRSLWAEGARAMAGESPEMSPVEAKAYESVHGEPPTDVYSESLGIGEVDAIAASVAARLSGGVEAIAASVESRLSGGVEAIAASVAASSRHAVGSRSRWAEGARIMAGESRAETVEVTAYESSTVTNNNTTNNIINGGVSITVEGEGDADAIAASVESRLSGVWGNG